MKYGYARVSSKEQNLARQLEALTTLVPDLDEEHIFKDKQSGKDFNREQYVLMKETVVAGDEIFIEELDRLGRNKDEVKSELEWFKQHKITVRVFDVPTTMIDFHGQEWIGDMVNNILIEVLGAVAEQERKKNHKRQSEGIAAMPVVDGKKVSARSGRGFGRPKSEVDREAFEKIAKKQKEGLISAAEGAKELGISRSTYYNLLRTVG